MCHQSHSQSVSWLRQQDTTGNIAACSLSSGVLRISEAKQRLQLLKTNRNDSVFINLSEYTSKKAQSQIVLSGTLREKQYDIHLSIRLR